MSAGNERKFIDFQQSKEKGGRSIKCPLLVIAAAVNNRRNMIEPADCLKEECAWWDESQGRCAIKETAICLEYISIDLTKLVEKMLHEELFRK